MVDLSALLLSLNSLSADEKVSLGRDWYSKTYLDQKLFGIHKLHDDEYVMFHGNRFEHAFFTSTDLIRKPLDKSVPDYGRIARVRWIGEVIAGRVPQSACWEVTANSGRPGIPNRLYVVYKPCYVVWLEPRTPSSEHQPPVEWRFSSAYPIFPQYIRDKTRGENVIWRFDDKKVAP
jgi:hypothetical protein